MARYFEVVRVSGPLRRTETRPIGLVEAEDVREAAAKIKAAGGCIDESRFRRGEVEAFFVASSIKGGYESPAQANEYNSDYNRAREDAHAKNFPGLTSDFRPRPTDLRVLTDGELTALAN